MPPILQRIKPILRAPASGARFLWGHRRLVLIGLALALLAWVFRPLWQPLVIFGGVHFFEIAAYVAVAVTLGRLLKSRRWKPIFAITAVAGLWLYCIYAWNLSPYDYVTLHYRYGQVSKEEVKSLPITSSERVQPFHAIFKAAEQMTSDSKITPTDPDIVRDGSSYRYTLAFEPDGFFRKRLNQVESVISMPVTSAAPDFSGPAQSKVAFSVGEEMAWSRSAKSAATRSVGIRMFRYTPADVRYLRDDKGKWVEVVSLTHWRGFVFPWPEFGGVVVFRQEPDGGSTVHRTLFGGGEWVPPGEIARHPYLVGQNLVPYEVSRWIAESFRFRRGIAGPITHNGDVRIPDIEGDKNLQPFTVAAKFDGDKAVRLWHYFGLEPFDAAKRGLSVSLFVPADGIGPVKVVDHGDQSGLLGVSAVPAHVRAKENKIDWSDNTPVEHRPYIRSILGGVRLLWLTTIVTKDFVAGADPQMALTDAQTRTVIRVEAREPETWVARIEAELRKGTAAVEPEAPLTAK
ncbi:MAG TPA: hypothetical protein VJJ47_01510 [Candidatus Paceibacterota bacterium]